jgi:hypothetical protein
MARGIQPVCIVAILAALVATLGGSPAAGEPPEKKEEPTPSSAHVSPDKIALDVGANTHVSKANDGIHHTESVIAAHPTDPARLFIASMYDPGVVGYCSDDGGKTWRACFERNSEPDQGDRKEFVGDPSAGFGPDGSLHFVCMRHWDSDKPPHAKLGDPDVGRLEFSRSTDGGKTWGTPNSIPTFTDRPWLAADCSDGKYRGRLYCFATIDKPVLHVSNDQGKTFAAPVIWPVKEGLMPRPVNPVVLTDGTVVLLCGLDPQNYGLAPTNPKGRVQIATFLSRDGGASLQEGALVATYWGDSIFRFPQLAADTATEKYRDRLYAVWTDGALVSRTRRPQARIVFSSSQDKGRSWAEPQVLSEQPTTPQDDKDYAAFLPSIAVNKYGAIAVSWYDRRGLAVDPEDNGYPSGWNVRLRVSLDGGETWQPSAQVNEKAGKGACNELRESAGLAADAAGDFHPVWIDDRTGKRQVWTATVRVEGK